MQDKQPLGKFDMKKSEIMEKYWVEFLRWWAHSPQPPGTSLEHWFWCWYLDEKLDK